MKSLFKRLLTVALAVCLLIPLSFAAFAAETGSASSAPSPSLPTPYTIEYDKYYSLYAGYPNTMTHYLVYERIASTHSKEGAKYAIIEELNKLPKLQEVSVPSNARVMMDMLFIGMDGVKRQMYITANALHVGGKAYRMSDTQYYRLLTVIDDALYDGTPYARWLVYMSPRKITKIVCTDETGRTFDIKESNLIPAANYMKNIPVTYGRRYNAGLYNFSNVKNLFKVSVHFNDNIVYNLYFTNTELYIESNGINYGCRYTMGFRDQVGAFFKEAEKGDPKAKAPAKDDSDASSAKSK